MKKLKNKYFVIGNPISHSKSPIMFNYLFNKFNLDAQYSRLNLNNINDLDFFLKYVKIDGFNITSPFKNEISKFFNLPESIYNTVILKPELKLYNTDYIYLKEIIDNYDFNNKRILIIGNGSTSFLIGFILNSKNIQYDIIARKDKNKFICNKFIELNKLSEVISKYDIIFNTIPQSKLYLSKDLKLNNKIFIDSIYNDNFWEKVNNSSHYYSGLEWLIKQGIESFQIFTQISFENFDKQLIYNELFNLLNKKFDYSNIILIGYMQSGKSYIGREISDKLKMNFIDTDKLIEENENILNDFLIGSNLLYTIKIKIQKI